MVLAEANDIIVRKLTRPYLARITLIAILSSLLALGQLFGVKEDSVVAQSTLDGESQLPSQVEAAACPTPYASEHQRIGFNFDRSVGQSVDAYDYSQLNAGWYHDYARQQAPPDNIRYHQMIRSGINISRLDELVGPVVDANSGAIWYVGNEPDRPGGEEGSEGQDNQTPAEYALFYHDVYTFLKARDPSAQVALAGVVQATPIRLAYLDAILDEYQSRYGQKLPVDIMTVHGFILCEVCEWGADIPPGMDDSAALGRNYEVSQHMDLDIFKEQIIAMRQWMADRGYRDKPLIVNEYGVLMPVTFEGFGYQDVRDFMLGTFDFFFTATDDQIGLASDGGRLVQEFAWFSLNSEPYNEETFAGFNGELFVHDAGEITQWGRDFAQYVSPLVRESDVYVENVRLSPGLIAVAEAGNTDGTTTTPGEQPPEIEVTVTLGNQGQLPAYGTTVKLWLGEPDSGGTLLEEKILSSAIAINPNDNPATTSTVTFRWSPATLALGPLALAVEVEVDDCNPERTNENHNVSAQLVVINQAELRESYLPVVQ